MAKFFSITAVVLFFGTLTLGWLNYNNVVAKEEQVVGAWAQVESTMQRKYDLLPNLVEAVQGSARHEKDVLLEVTKQRHSGIDRLSEEIKASRIKLGSLGAYDRSPSAAQLQMVSQLQQQLDQSAMQLLVIAENYPNLYASESFLQLQSQLEGAENRINITRMQFNNAVRAYNVQIKKIPGNLIARFAGFQEKTYFVADKKALKQLKIEL